MTADGLWSRLLDFVSPRRCAVCGGRLAPTEHGLCSACLLRLPRTATWLTPSDNEVARLFWGRLPVCRAAAFFYFERRSEAARAIYEMKYHGRPDTGYDLGRLAAAEMGAAGFFSGIDVVVPVPLARRRLRQRGYNQSEYIARGVASAAGLPVETRAVRRTVFTQSQTRLSHRERADNVEGAFSPADTNRLHGRHVLMVDDVVTTGATLAACGAALAGVPGVRLSVMALGFAK